MGSHPHSIPGREQLKVQRLLAMGVDLSERQTQRSADHPPAVGKLSQVVLPIKNGTPMSIEKVVYTARAKVIGGRVGTAKSEDLTK